MYSIPVGMTSIGLTFKVGTFQTHLCKYSPRTWLLGLLSAFLPAQPPRSRWTPTCQVILSVSLWQVSPVTSGASFPASHLPHNWVDMQENEGMPASWCCSCIKTGSWQFWYHGCTTLPTGPELVLLGRKAMEVGGRVGWGSLSLRGYRDGRADVDEVVLLPEFLGQKPGQKDRLGNSSSCAY